MAEVTEAGIGLAYRPTAAELREALTLRARATRTARARRLAVGAHLLNVLPARRLGPRRGRAQLPRPLLLETAHQFAAMALVSAGDEAAAQWCRDPQEAAALVRELVAGGELSSDEVLDSAMPTGSPDAAGGTRRVRPEHGGGAVPDAVPHIALAVTPASADLD
ncbi:hypothetical protein [Streptomyces sp. NBC_01803]|uniref:hypothetical protein n=1 Tax=Streptomyces sp. NBC_01803 TaxID=2975946 RepID=UPI002DD87EF8|nr:hypothetical protein [Streptomyces sp. NBC_01803]WSA42788.1 hypothetical protein OIE51_00335 [Streptomyces sp. NBC_01803]